MNTADLCRYSLRGTRDRARTEMKRTMSWRSGKAREPAPQWLAVATAPTPVTNWKVPFNHRSGLGSGVMAWRDDGLVVRSEPRCFAWSSHRPLGETSSTCWWQGSIMSTILRGPRQVKRLANASPTPGKAARLPSRSTLLRDSQGTTRRRHDACEVPGLRGTVRPAEHLDTAQELSDGRVGVG